ncbi:DUF2188 domain-containing protein [Arthrobacter sp. NPDC089319]|uniref:DUF2188 domain-containing protein n=1 Tax=Arthrobacter sp. NPDC089319 TaxID=3155915 RepID=UPI00341F6A32
MNVYKDGDQWKAKRQGASRASVVADTQQQAYDRGRNILSRSGGGDISVHGLNGKIRDKNTIKPARDPRSTKG